MKCPKCGSVDGGKDGIVKERPRYKCKACGYRHTVSHWGFSPAIKRQALQLYLEGLGFRSIGRFLKGRHVAVYNWIKAMGSPWNRFAQRRALKWLKGMRGTPMLALKKLLLARDCW